MCQVLFFRIFHSRNKLQRFVDNEITRKFFFCIVTILCMTSQTLKQNFAGFWKILQKVHSRAIDVNKSTNSEFLMPLLKEKNQMDVT